jgi:secreted PhoX family phosphatase
MSDVSLNAKRLHDVLFSEEFDYMMDSISDSRDRSKGINPMSSDYIKRIEDKRNKLGVSQLGSDGMPVSNDSILFCEREMEAFEKNEKTEYTDLVKTILSENGYHTDNQYQFLKLFLG